MTVAVVLDVLGQGQWVSAVALATSLPLFLPVLSMWFSSFSGESELPRHPFLPCLILPELVAVFWNQEPGLILELIAFHESITMPPKHLPYKQIMN